MQFIRTKEFILKFNSIEQRKIALLQKIKSSDKVTEKDLQDLSNLLKRGEIPLLKILLGELESIKEQKAALKRTVLRKRYSTLWNILKRTGKLSKAIEVFLQKAEEDASKTDEILEMIRNRHEDFYSEHPGWDDEFKKIIKEEAAKLGEDIELEMKLETNDANKIIKTYLRIARNIPGSKITKIIEFARKAKGSIVKIAACFLIAALCWKTLTFTDQAPTHPGNFTVKYTHRRWE